MDALAKNDRVSVAIVHRRASFVPIDRGAHRQFKPEPMTGITHMDEALNFRTGDVRNVRMSKSKTHS